MDPQEYTIYLEEYTSYLNDTFHLEVLEVNNTDNCLLHALSLVLFGNENQSTLIGDAVTNASHEHIFQKANELGIKITVFNAMNPIKDQQIQHYGVDSEDIKVQSTNKYIQLCSPYSLSLLYINGHFHGLKPIPGKHACEDTTNAIADHINIHLTNLLKERKKKTNQSLEPSPEQNNQNLSPQICSVMQYLKQDTIPMAVEWTRPKAAFDYNSAGGDCFLLPVHLPKCLCCGEEKKLDFTGEDCFTYILLDSGCNGTMVNIQDALCLPTEHTSQNYQYYRILPERRVIGVIITHFDHDHYGGLFEMLAENLPLSTQPFLKHLTFIVGTDAYKDERKGKTDKMKGKTDLTKGKTDETQDKTPQGKLRKLLEKEKPTSPTPKDPNIWSINDEISLHLTAEGKKKFQWFLWRCAHVNTEVNTKDNTEVNTKDNTEADKAPFYVVSVDKTTDDSTSPSDPTKDDSCTNINSIVTRYSRALPHNGASNPRLQHYLFTGDSIYDRILPLLPQIYSQMGLETVRFDAYQLPHHGSIRNNLRFKKTSVEPASEPTPEQIISTLKPASKRTPKQIISTFKEVLKSRSCSFFVTCPGTRLHLDSRLYDQFAAVAQKLKYPLTLQMGYPRMNSPDFVSNTENFLTRNWFQNDGQKDGLNKTYYCQIPCQSDEIEHHSRLEFFNHQMKGNGEHDSDDKQDGKQEEEEVQNEALLSQLLQSYDFLIALSNSHFSPKEQMSFAIPLSSQVGDQLNCNISQGAEIYTKLGVNGLLEWIQFPISIKQDSNATPDVTTSTTSSSQQPPSQESPQEIEYVSVNLSYEHQDCSQMIFYRNAQVLCGGSRGGETFQISLSEAILVSRLNSPSPTVSKDHTFTITPPATPHTTLISTFRESSRGLFVLVRSCTESLFSFSDLNEYLSELQRNVQKLKRHLSKLDIKNFNFNSSTIPGVESKDVPIIKNVTFFLTSIAHAEIILEQSVKIPFIGLRSSNVTLLYSFGKTTTEAESERDFIERDHDDPFTVETTTEAENESDSTQHDHDDSPKFVTSPLYFTISTASQSADFTTSEVSNNRNWKDEINFTLLQASHSKLALTPPLSPLSTFSLSNLFKEHSFALETLNKLVTKLADQYGIDLVSSNIKYYEISFSEQPSPIEEKPDPIEEKPDPIEEKPDPIDQIYIELDPNFVTSRYRDPDYDSVFKFTSIELNYFSPSHQVITLYGESIEQENNPTTHFLASFSSIGPDSKALKLKLLPHSNKIKSLVETFVKSKDPDGDSSLPKALKLKLLPHSNKIKSLVETFVKSKDPDGDSSLPIIDLPIIDLHLKKFSSAVLVQQALDNPQSLVQYIYKFHHLLKRTYSRSNSPTVQAHLNTCGFHFIKAYAKNSSIFDGMKITFDTFDFHNDNDANLIIDQSIDLPLEKSTHFIFIKIQSQWVQLDFNFKFVRWWELFEHLKDRCDQSELFEHLKDRCDQSVIVFASTTNPQLHIQDNVKFMTDNNSARHYIDLHYKPCKPHESTSIPTIPDPKSATLQDFRAAVSRFTAPLRLSPSIMQHECEMFSGIMESLPSPDALLSNSELGDYYFVDSAKNEETRNLLLEILSNPYNTTVLALIIYNEDKPQHQFIWKYDKNKPQLEVPDLNLDDYKSMRYIAVMKPYPITKKLFWEISNNTTFARDYKHLPLKLVVEYDGKSGLTRDFASVFSTNCIHPLNKDINKSGLLTYIGPSELIFRRSNLDPVKHHFQELNREIDHVALRRRLEELEQRLKEHAKATEVFIQSLPSNPITYSHFHFESGHKTIDVDLLAALQ